MSFGISPAKLQLRLTLRMNLEQRFSFGDDIANRP